MRLIIKHKVLLLHIIFWGLFISYQLYDYTRYLSFDKAALFLLYPMSFNFAISYVHYFFVLPYLLKKNKLLKYIGLTLLLFLIFGAIRIAFDEYTVAKASPDPAYYEQIHVARILSILWGFISFMVFTSMIKLTANWYDLESKRKQLQNEKLTAELNHLKAQINPHFLFNTLHNLNYLTLRKSDEASGVIIKLSNIMRYMIYEANKENVPIYNEINYMKDYIDLEKIRLNKNFKLDLNTSGLDKNITIAPLLLITFLENAFKHGVSDRANNCWIKIKIEAYNNALTYTVANSKVKISNNQNASGFGLDNLKKRLALQYPDSHKLSISQNEDEFKTKLTLNL
ncbi:histidine kinase [Mangrovivirga sp. M17]|uniref:Histidine kinase n=1 Tax=Mangrovivirga halotolerans TaxID=2993936 RepID=A0ABT3RUT6_9BACT|nr:histidine kinase [Mangrovivirga halotolerans]MCX2745332.1 histidine kinase [Mangrovivirga halotolerans]